MTSLCYLGDWNATVFKYEAMWAYTQEKYEATANCDALLRLNNW